MSLQAAAEDVQGGSSSYGDGEIVPPLGTEGGEAPQEKRSSLRETVARLAGWARRPVAAERSGRADV